MYSDAKEIANRLKSLSWYIEINKNRYCSMEEAFLAGYKKALEDAVELMKEIKHKNNQCYN